MEINIYTKHKAEDFELEIQAEEGNFGYYITPYQINSNDDMEEGELHHIYKLPEWIEEHIDLSPDRVRSKEEADKLNKYWDQINVKRGRKNEVLHE